MGKWAKYFQFRHVIGTIAEGAFYHAWRLFGRNTQNKFFFESITSSSISFFFRYLPPSFHPSLKRKKKYVWEIFTRLLAGYVQTACIGVPLKKRWRDSSPEAAAVSSHSRLLIENSILFYSSEVCISFLLFLQIYFRDLFQPSILMFLKNKKITALALLHW